MCLFVFAWKVVQGTPLFAISNRDEFHDRPTLPAHWWEDAPDIYAGKDLKANGTWLGITKQGKFAAITNVRDKSIPYIEDAPSRGLLVADYLKSELSPQAYIDQLSSDQRFFNGYNLIVGDKDTLIWYSNRYPDDERNGKPLKSGIYGLSNGKLDEGWRKVTRAKAQFSSLLYQCAPLDTYFELLKDCTRASECRLPDTGISTELESILSSIFVFSPKYGTRSSNVAMIHTDKAPVLIEHVIPPSDTPPYPIVVEHLPNGTCQKRKPSKTPSEG